ncbi:SDR family oxidoreductase [Acuticoccus sediminis]|uniref:SDR family oxidoreductase n=1 Tax=Acuticoccus sediminis TaxID=2184697 RepID=UPI001CFDF9AC|nr:SDR family oxidoreductase [Acuticoccus sediminis]
MGKTVFITGCSSGFGEATARLFAQSGANVVATARRPEAARHLEAHGSVLVTRLDVRDRTSIYKAVRETEARFGGIDILVNNAGFGLAGVFEATPRQKVKEQFEVNLFGLMDVTRTVLPSMRAQGSGVVVNVSSGAGIVALPMISLYCASKFALEGFSESLWYELASVGIRVKLVEPGSVTATHFGRRVGGELASVDHVEDYAPFVEAATGVFAGINDDPSAGSVEDVAKTIVAAATDPSDRLRYIATDDIVPLIKARRETSEDRYMRMMHDRYDPMAAPAFTRARG